MSNGNCWIMVNVGTAGKDENFPAPEAPVIINLQLHVCDHAQLNILYTLFNYIRFCKANCECL